MSIDGPLRVLVTGSRETTRHDDTFITRKIAEEAGPALAAGRAVVVVHGKCPYGGADLAADRWAEKTSGVVPERHPAQRVRGRLLGPERNTVMVAAGADVCLAFPGPDSVGTIDCLVKAIKAGIPTHVWPLR